MEKKKLKIAIIAKLFAPISPSSAGGTETFVYNLARELKKRGHEITLFASGDSRIEDVKIIPVVQESYWFKFKKPIQTGNKMLLYRKYMSDEILGYLKFLFYLRAHEKEFDIIHDNALYFLPIVLHNFFFKLPFVTTLHVPEKSFSDIFQIMNDLLDSKSFNDYFISISENQYYSMKEINPFAVNYNGIDEERFQFSQGRDDYLFWIGRIVPEKGLDKAIEISSKTKYPLKVVGAIADQTYFDKIIEPLLKANSQVTYFKEVVGQDLVKLYQNAKALLFTINWDEPFGLVMIEAMACGTPVIAFNRGAVSEVIKDGETGFICPAGDIDAMARAVKKIYEMPDAQYQAMRRVCRKHIEENFTVKKMVDGYEKIYQKVIEDWKRKSRKIENS